MLSRCSKKKTFCYAASVYVQDIFSYLFTFGGGSFESRCDRGHPAVVFYNIFGTALIIFFSYACMMLSAHLTSKRNGLKSLCVVGALSSAETPVTNLDRTSPTAQTKFDRVSKLVW